MSADRQWFIDQGQREYHTEVFGEHTVRLQSLDVLTKAQIAARVSKECTVNDELDTERFAVEHAVALMAASIVDAEGHQVFSDSQEDVAIIKGLRSRVGDVLDRAVQRLSFAPQDRPAKN